MKVLCVGDVVGRPGLDFCCDRLPALKRELGADFTIINGENSHASGVGITRQEADTLLQYADVVTTGNHCYHQVGESLFEETERLLHPANLPFTADETGCICMDTGRNGALLVLNLQGTAYLEALDNPFSRADALLEKHSGAKFVVVDFHAESTAEKQALAFYLDGRVSAMFGTHTHVQTADARVLPKGTGYIGDVGMTGPYYSVIGTRPEQSILKQRAHAPTKFDVAEGVCLMNAVLFTLNNTSGLCEAVQAVAVSAKATTLLPAVLV